MTYLLDTNACINFLNPGHDALTEKVCRFGNEICLCSVVKAELYFGAYHSGKREKNLSVLESFFAEFCSLPFEDSAAETYGRLRTDLQKKGCPIGPYDLQIASVALLQNLTLVTHNVAEFNRVSGLQIEDWEND